MTYLDDKRLNLIYRLLGAKIQSSQAISGYMNEKHSYADKDSLFMREAHFITAIMPGETKTMSSVAQALAVTQSAASQIATRLENKGYIMRSHSPEDRRIVNVSLTEKGEEFYREHVEFDTEEFMELDKVFMTNYTDEELELLLDYETKMGAFFTRKKI